MPEAQNPLSEDPVLDAALAADLSEPVAMDPQVAMARLQTLFATMVPPDRLELVDALGNSYTARAVLPARSQILVMQQLKKLWQQDITIPESTSDLAGMAGVMVSLAADPKVLDGICDAFTAAHPKVVDRAVAASVSADEGYTHPADLFPVEELVAGLVPFFIRFAARAANLAATVSGMPEA